MTQSNASALVAINAAVNAVSNGKAPIYSDKEMAVVKAVATSVFANPVGDVPSYTLPLELPESIAIKSLPGLLASLNKKGVLLTEKFKGMSVIKLTTIGKALAS